MEKAFVGNAADKDQVKSAGKKEKFKRREELSDVRHILSSPQGQRFLWRYLTDTGVFKSSWHPSALIHFNEGRRDVGLALLADITKADPGAFIKMMNDHREDSEED